MEDFKDIMFIFILLSSNKNAHLFVLYPVLKIKTIN